MARRGETVEQWQLQAVEEKIYVAVGRNVDESKLNLLWTLKNFGGKKVCILHVHQSSWMGGNFPASKLNEHEVRAYQELERQFMHKALDDYLLICQQEGVRAEKLHIEMDYIEEGIVELINRHAIKRLVMGAAADKHFIEGMMDPNSIKAKYVSLHAPHSCQIWFICKGHLICSGEGNLNRVNLEFLASSLRESSINETLLLSSSNEVLGSLNSISHERSEGTEFQLALTTLPPSEEDLQHFPPPNVLAGSGIGGLYDQLGKALADVEKLKREAFEVSIKCAKAEKTASEAVHRSKVLESLYSEELRRRKEIDEALVKEKEDSKKMKNQQDEELLVALDHKLLLESQVASSDHMMKELHEKVISAVELLQFYKKERDELQEQRDNALQLTEDLLKKQAEEASSTHTHKFFSEFSYSEIYEATSDLNPSLKIGEGGYGSIYKGFLRHTEVAIKVLDPDSLQGPSEFQQEVDALSKLRHPNLVTLIGTCPEACALIYEYLPNGSLEDRLSCKDNTPPLSWQTRIHIAAELCSVLIFLHSSKPHSIVHGDLKPGNILLDANFVSKLSDFGICRALSLHENLSDNMTLCHRTDPKGSFLYLDPQFLTMGELSPKSDIYSFGIILLQLLTGRPALRIAKDVQDALSEGNLIALLDTTAGDWPFVQAQQLAHLGLRCCQMNRSDRPDLASEVWRVLEPMRTSCGSSFSFQLGSEEQSEPPSFFICPILQEVMQDPHVAADGFTYEAEALQGWLDAGHDTSPMTNLALSNCDLVPNHALRSAIQEWQQRQQRN